MVSLALKASLLCQEFRVTLNRQGTGVQEAELGGRKNIEPCTHLEEVVTLFKGVKLLRHDVMSARIAATEVVLCTELQERLEISRCTSPAARILQWVPITLLCRFHS